MESLAQAPEACREEIGVSWRHVAPSEALPRDDAGLRGHADRNDAIAPRTFHAGDHTRDLFARDPRRAASRNAKRREAFIWTQMDPSFASGAVSDNKSKIQEFSGRGARI